MRRTIEDVFLVERNVVSAQGPQKLGLEVLGLVMCGLPFDVSFLRVLLRLAHRKCERPFVKVTMWRRS